ncbi:MAG TPA: RHS repeat protein [Phycisphaerae bacterium]|nr:RHS repeat protein [Phycisphaerae bacterium]HNU44159.1 RHS repeat protein [Phycisphaerae bacterium]
MPKPKVPVCRQAGRHALVATDHLATNKHGGAALGHATRWLSASVQCGVAQTDESGTNLARAFTYSYNDAAGEYSRTGPDGMVTSVRLDVGGRVEYYRRGPVQGDPVMTATYTYYDDNRVHTVTLGNGGTTQYTYDVAGRVAEIERRPGHEGVAPTPSPCPLPQRGRGV